MGHPLKSKLIKEMKQTMNTLRGGFIKKAASKSSFRSENDSDKVFEMFRNNMDDRNIVYFDYLRYMHYFYFFEIKGCFLEINLMFPDSFDSYEDLKEKTKVDVATVSIYDKNDKIRSFFTFNEFESRASEFLFLVNFFESNNIYDQPQKSVKDFIVNQFKDAFHSKNNEFKDYINYIKDKESILLEVINTKNAFVEKRRAINKAQKEGKKKHNGTVKQKISQNEKEIRDLQRKIQALKNENTELANQQHYPESDLRDKQSLEYTYNITLEYFLKDHGRDVQQSPFVESFELMLSK